MVCGQIQTNTSQPRHQIESNLPTQSKKQQKKMQEQPQKTHPKKSSFHTGTSSSSTRSPQNPVPKKTIVMNDCICQLLDNSYVNGNMICGEVIVRNKDDGRVVYEGEFFNSEKCGFGVDYDQMGEVAYQGEFVHGKRDGWGRTKEYQGQFKEDDFDGWGRFFTKQVLYEGYFLAGRYNGVGVYILAQQEFKHAQILGKQTKIDEFLIAEISKDQKQLFEKFNIEEIYIGQWLKGLKNGLGKLWRQNDYWYSGQFAYNSLYGHGVRRTPESKTQKGVFMKDQFKGSL